MPNPARALVLQLLPAQAYHKKHKRRLEHVAAEQAKPQTLDVVAKVYDHYIDDGGAHDVVAHDVNYGAPELLPCTSQDARESGLKRNKSRQRSTLTSMNEKYRARQVRACELG